jgi:hypothetical protein
MKPDDFEQELQRQPIRSVPEEWRTGILQAARHDARSQRLASHVEPIFWWRHWLWPCPQAWAGLAAVWMIILGLNATARKPLALAANPPLTPSPETQITLAAQRRELARLLENFAEPTPAPKPVPASPRSEGSSPSKA